MEKITFSRTGISKDIMLLMARTSELDAAIEQFDNVWIGKFCKDCGRREYCSDPIK